MSEYRLDDQVGFLLRRAFQRHAAIFNGRMPDNLTTTQFAALAKLAEEGSLSQNQLGRATAMDAATIKGVVDRLAGRGLVAVTADTTDQRRVVVSLTPTGKRLAKRCFKVAHEISHETLSPLDKAEVDSLLELLRRIADG